MIPMPQPTGRTLDILIRAARPGQTLDELEASAGDIATARHTLAAAAEAGRPLADVTKWWLGEASTSVTEQLCVRAELPAGPIRDRELGNMRAIATVQGTTAIRLLIARAQEVEARNVGLF